jgi:flagellar hook-length control protein FliK
MSHIHWLGADLDLDRLRPDRQSHVERASFEGFLGPVSTSVVGTTAQVEVAAPFECRSIIEQLAIRISECGSEMSLHWDTAELGSLDLVISRDGDQVHVTLTTNDANAAALLERHAGLLGELLAEEGLQLARYTVLPTAGRRSDIDSERSDSEAEINSLLGVIRRASSR